MTYLQSLFLGIVQGVAEFLPISSSGHLALFQRLMGVTAEADMFYDVLLHLGTLIAVFAAYYSDIIEMIKEFFRFIAELLGKREKSKAVPPARRLILLVVVATVPLVLILFVQDYITALFDNTLYVGCALLVTGGLLFLSDRFKNGRKNAMTATVLDALIVGLFQAVAVTPGLSRSGTTISAGLFRKFDREFAVRLSFLMSIPAVLGALLLNVVDVAKTGINTALMGQYAVGFITSIVFGYLSICLLKLIVKKGKFGGFAYYCWIVGVVTIILTIAL